jgi:HK97 gp10 family phage protein
MADMFRIEINGLEDLLNKFATMEGQLDKVLEQATAAGAAVVVREAGINSRKGGQGGVRVRDDFPMKQTGNLMRSITVIRKKGTPGRVEMQVGSAMDYALRLEYGFNDVDKKGRRYHQRPRPYLRPALDEHQDEIQEEFEKAVRKFEELFSR